MTLRWFGPTDPIPLGLHPPDPGGHAAWSAPSTTCPSATPGLALRSSASPTQVDAAGLSLAVIESIPVHEDIKLGRPSRDRLVDALLRERRATSARSACPSLCYNFMPVFDWMRTDLAMRLPDGSTALAFDDDALAQIDLSRGTRDLPGWAAAYDAAELRALLDAYRPVTRRAAVGEPGLFPRARRSRRRKRRRPPRDPSRRSAVVASSACRAS